MNHYDEEILRLNKKIKQLIWTNEQNMSRTGQLEAENKRLTFKVNEMKEICSLTSSLNVKYKMQLDKETTDREDILEANHKLKLKLNSMSVMCNELNQRIKVLEYSLQRKNATRMTQPQVRLISSEEDIVITRPKQDEAFNDLQKRYNELDAEHQEALNVIDELEFELGDIDYLEMETQRLQQENIKLKEMLQQAGISTTQNLSETGREANEAGNNLSNSTPKESDEEAHENDEFMNELKEIQTRKMMIQQKLDQFHHRQSVSYDKSD